MLVTDAPIKKLKAKGLIRQRVINEPNHFNFDKVKINHQICINFSTNDYLGLSKHPKVIKACQNGLDHYGFGSGASAMVSGYSKAQQQLEESFAGYVKRPAAIFFNSGYHANLAVMQCFTGKNSHVIADKFIHASIIDGIKLSNTKLHRYPHNKLDGAAQQLKKVLNNKCLVTESIFSMEGGISNLIQLARLAAENQAFFIVDDAHGFGILGQSGSGACEKNNLNINQVPLLITPLGKAAGGMGAMVSGSSENIEQLLQFARSYRYSTALPPAISSGLLESLKALQTESWRREKLYENIGHFLRLASQIGLNLVSTDPTPIMSIIIGENNKTEKLQKQLINTGFFVSCIRPPTVPQNTARLRITLTCYHQKNDITKLINLIITEISKP